MVHTSLFSLTPTIHHFAGQCYPSCKKNNADKTETGTFPDSGLQCRLHIQFRNQSSIFVIFDARASISFACTSDGACSYLANAYSKTPLPPVMERKFVEYP